MLSCLVIPSSLLTGQELHVQQFFCISLQVLLSKLLWLHAEGAG